MENLGNWGQRRAGSRALRVDHSSLTGGGTNPMLQLDGLKRIVSAFVNKLHHGTHNKWLGVLLIVNIEATIDQPSRKRGETGAMGGLVGVGIFMFLTIEK